MSYIRSAREQAEHDRVFYPGTETLRNKLDIRDPHKLDQAERLLTTNRALEPFPPDAHHRNYAGFKAIHRHLFQDLYDWAGQERTYTTGRGPVPFAVPEHITGWMEAQFTIIAEENYLIGLDPDPFANRAAEFVNEINAGHPFIDGNGRTQRNWLRLLCEGAGYQLTFETTDRERWNESSRIGFDESDHAPMAELIGERLTHAGHTNTRDDQEPSLKKHLTKRRSKGRGR